MAITLHSKRIRKPMIHYQTGIKNPLVYNEKSKKDTRIRNYTMSFQRNLP